MVLAYFCTPWLEKKLGSIITVALGTILCIPLMLLMANGAIFGANVAWAIGIILFLRSGFANAAGPIKESLPLTFVSKNLVPAYNSIMLIVNGLVGIFAIYYLLRTLSGYGTAYYIASVVYLIGSIGILLVLFKKYNRNSENNNKK